MANTTRLITYILACLTALSSTAALVLGSWVLHKLKKLHDVTDYSYGGSDITSSDIDIPVGVTPTFVQPFVWPNTAQLWALPGTEIATGAIGLVFAVLVCSYVLAKARSSRRHDITQYGWGDAVAQGSIALMVLAVAVLFIYVFAVSGHSETMTHLSLGGALGGAGWDAPPTWEVWTCAISSYLEENRDFPANRPEWKKVCTLTTGARWSLLPVVVFTIASAVALVALQYRSTPKESDMEMTKMGRRRTNRGDE